MRKLAVKKLGDKFADYLLTIACRRCGHVKAADPKAVAKITGWETTLEELAKRLRCSDCG